MGDIMNGIRDWYNFLDGIPHSIVVKDYFNDGNGGFYGGRYSRVSKTKADHHDREIREMRGLTDFDLHPRKEAERMLADDLWVMQNNKVIKNRLEQVTHADGKKVWVSVTKIPRIEAKAVCGIISISIDVNEQVEAQMRAARLNRFLVKRIYAPMIIIMPLINKLGPKNAKLVKAINEIFTRVRKLLLAIS